MDAARLIRDARRRAGLSLRALAIRARTSHSTLSAYEAGDKVPSAANLERIVRSAGFAIEPRLVPLVAVDDLEARGRELLDALELAAQFPVRHRPMVRPMRLGTR